MAMKLFLPNQQEMTLLDRAQEEESPWSIEEEFRPGSRVSPLDPAGTLQIPPESAITQGTFGDRHPFLRNLGQMALEVTGYAPSKRFMQGIERAQSPVLRPQTPYEWADYAAGQAASLGETALAGVDLAAATKPAQMGIQAAGRGIARGIEDMGEAVAGALTPGFGGRPSKQMAQEARDRAIMFKEKWQDTPMNEIPREEQLNQAIPSDMVTPEIHNAPFVNMQAAREVRPIVDPETGKKIKFGQDLSPETAKIVRSFDRRRGESAVHPNAKTGLSVDFSTTCPKRGCADGACPYCYVESGRAADELFNMKGGNKGVDINNDYAGEVMEFNDELVQELNKDGGLRMFSFGDFRPGIDDNNVARLLDDAQEKGLYIKAITKQPEFIERFGDHPNLRANISVDNVPRDISENAPTIEEALALKAGRENIQIRAVALNQAEADMYAEHPDINVVTLYHGLTNFDSKGNRHNKLMQIIERQNPQLVEKVGREKLQAYTDTWENFAPRSKARKAMNEKHPGKMCCESGKCRGDKTKCGFGLGALLAGIRLPELMDEE